MYRLKSPLAAQLELTEACNNACLHCYNYWRYLETGKKYCLDPQKKNLGYFQSLLVKLLENEVLTITFTGGEPFLRRDILFDLIATAKTSKARVGVNTNGSLIKKEDVFKLGEAGVDFLLVSLLCDDPLVHNEIANAEVHFRTSEAIRDLSEAGLDIATNMVVSSRNWSRVRQTAIYAQSLGVKNFSATPIIPCPLSKGHLNLVLEPTQVKQVLDDLLWVRQQGMSVDVLEPLTHCMFDPEERIRFSRFLNHRSCSAGISEMVVSSEGEVRPCVMSTQTYGNLVADSWEKVWDNLSTWCSPSFLPDDCLNCSCVDECGGGCRVSALANTDLVNGKDPYMTNPLSLNDLATKVIPTDVSRSRQEDLTMIFHQQTSLRGEEFGCVISQGRDFLFLDQDGAMLLNHLKKQQAFTILSIIEEFDIDKEELVRFLGILMDRGFLISVS